MIPFPGEGSDKNEIKICEISGFRSVDVEVSDPWTCYVE
jgi:hypothetical protein